MYYIKKTRQEMFPYEDGMDMSGVSISDTDRMNGSPKKGDMIAINPNNKSDKWLVAEQFFKNNYMRADKVVITKERL